MQHIDGTKGKMEAIWVTGGAGFMSSNFIRRALHFFSQWCIVNLDALIYGENIDSLHNIATDRLPTF